MSRLQFTINFCRSEVLGRLLSTVAEIEVRTIIHRQPNLLDLQIQNGLALSRSSVLFSVCYLFHFPDLYTVFIKVTPQEVTSGDWVIAGEYEAAYC